MLVMVPSLKTNLSGSLFQAQLARDYISSEDIISFSNLNHIGTQQLWLRQRRTICTHLLRKAW